jgi:hypothetical protein
VRTVSASRGSRSELPSSWQGADPIVEEIRRGFEAIDGQLGESGWVINAGGFEPFQTIFSRGVANKELDLSCCRPNYEDLILELGLRATYLLKAETDEIWEREYAQTTT